MIELMVAMVIILVLAGMVIGVSGLVNKQMGISKIKSKISTFEIAMEQYKSDWGFYPRSYNLDELHDVLLDSSNDLHFHNLQDKAYLPEMGTTLSDVEKYCKDFMDNPIFYQCPGDVNTTKFDLFSLGINGYAGVTSSATYDDENTYLGLDSDSDHISQAQDPDEFTDDECDDISNFSRK